MQSKRDILFLFNLELDLDSEVLAVAHYWVGEFASSVSKVFVFSTHVGTVSLPNNVEYSELGGGSLFKKIRGYLRLVGLIPLIFFRRRNLMVFHHMSPRTAVILGPVFRILGIPQGLWYSHSHRSLELTIASRIVNKIFSSTPQALPIKSSSSVFVGHGIPVERFIEWRNSNRERNLPMVSIGRLAPIKRYESGISLVSKLSRNEKQFIIIGPGNKLASYPVLLSDLACSLSVNLKFLGPRSYKAIPDLLADSNFFYSGTPMSVDKAAIEAALSGVFVLSENQNTMRLSGMQQLIESWDFQCGASLESIVGAIEKLEPYELHAARLKVSIEAELLSNLSNTCREILAHLQKSVRR